MNEQEEVKKILDKVKDEDLKKELGKDISDLLTKIRFPNNFCDTCGAQMFYNGQVFICKNCGPKAQATPPAPVAPVIAPPTPQIPVMPQLPPDPNQAKMNESLGMGVRMAKDSRAFKFKQ